MFTKAGRLPPVCHIAYLGVLPERECRRLAKIVEDNGSFYVWTAVGYGIRKGYAYKYTPPNQENLVPFSYQPL